ncbi:tyrosine-type recombinase/integrase [Agromyces neolithicus]|uniref:Site-specific integrase n=1 Tax=Agromyces neolithicus TaxID=269420 RepID=A0ABP4YRJ4_9MICO
MIRIEIEGHGVLVGGSLEGSARGFEAEFVRRGFTRKSLMNQLRLLAHLSRWLHAQSIDAGALTAQEVEVFLAERRRTHTGLFSRKALGPVLDWLANEGVIPADAAVVPVVADGPELAGFEEYLRAERRLADSTVAANMARARRFWAGYVVPAGGVGELTAAAVTRALLDEGVTRRPVSVKAFGYTLRSLLRFFFISGITSHDLSAATLVIRSPQPSRLPIGVSRDDVVALLTGCDRGTSAGLRDYVVLLLLARLGLRAIEVARLRLDDIDWRRGEVLVRGKGNRDERLPLTYEVGEAIVDYLHDARPSDTGFREVFAAGRAPRRPLTREAVGGIVERACDRAGLARFGAHRLRHTLGEQMVTAAVPLDAIGQVLRHTARLTTAGYARVDVTALRELAQPWPATTGGERA